MVNTQAGLLCPPLQMFILCLLNNTKNINEYVTETILQLLNHKHFTTPYQH